MKLNTKNIMKSKWECDSMNTNWKSSDASCSGMPSGKCLSSKNSRRVYNRFLKNKWRKEANRQMNEEINEAKDYE